MTPRDGFAAFLADAGWPGAGVEPLAGDASFRRYFRVTDRGRTAVLMDAPPELEDSGPFVRIADLLVSAGFAAPRLIAGDLDAGFLLIEDFGDRLMAPELAAGRACEDAVYAGAVELLASLHRLPPPLELKRYDRDELLREAMLFPDWYARAAGLDCDVEAFAAAWDTVWQPLLAETERGPVLVLRDYHAENLMLLDRPGVQGLGLLDFQDALAGHRAYDLVSLLQDARRDVSPRLERAMLSRFIAAAGIEDSFAFRRSYELLGLQRNVKILGIFVRLRDRDGRQGYVERLPRVWGHVERNLMHPAFAPLRDWFDRFVPLESRAAWCRG
jgi:hypothetical protein